MTNTRESGGISLSGLHKSYGQVHAVQGVDLDIAAGETVALLGPNGAGKSTTIDMLLGLSKPDAGSVQHLRHDAGGGRRPGRHRRDAPDRRPDPRPDRRELLEMMASLYPKPLARRRGARTVRHRGPGRPPYPGPVRRADPAGTGGDGAHLRPRPAGARRTDRRDGCRGAARVLERRCATFAASGRTVVFATHYLEEADLYADRIVLMAQGLIVADGPANEIKATVGRRNIRATLPDARLDLLGRPARRRRRRPTGHLGRAVLRRLRPGDPRAARRLPGGQGHRDHRCRPRGSVPDPDQDHRHRSICMNATYLRMEIMRTFRNRRFFIFSLVFPLVFFYLIAGAEQVRQAGRHLLRRLLPRPAWPASAPWPRCSPTVAASPASGRSAGTASCG